MAPATRRIRPVGSHALMVDLDGLPEVLAVAEKLRHAALPGVLDVIPAAATVTVTCARPSALDAVRELIRSLPPVLVSEAVPGRTLTVEVVYDGAELAGVAALTGLSVEGVVAAHSGQLWTAAFGGFAPGFAYLVGENNVLDVPRLQTPRTRVPAGSVAVAGGFSAVYPQDSPGGWQLLGHTEERMWDPDRQPPAFISPGDAVRFRPVRERTALAAPSADPAAGTVPDEGAPAPQNRPGGEHDTAEEPPAVLRVLAPGFRATIQDEGRPGNAGLGITPSGAMDRESFRQANALVGNPAGAAAVEVLFGGLRLEAEADVVVAVTGAPVPLTLHAGGESLPAPQGVPFTLQPGERLEFGHPGRGLRNYLAVRGGVQAREVLGSKATDTLSGTGPAPLTAGSALAAGSRPAGAVPFPLPVGAREAGDFPAAGSITELRVLLGPREDWFSAEALERFAATVWEVSPQSNRVGLRLTGATVERERTGELPSEGTVRGSIQVPASGQPVLFMADHPVTGGYPVIATVVDADLDRAGQLPPGSRVRFVPMAESAPAESVPAEPAQGRPRSDSGGHAGADAPGAPEEAAPEAELVLGRGLEAVLAIRRLQDAGVRTVAVYTTEDLDSRHARLADEAYRVEVYPRTAEGPEVGDLLRRSGAQRARMVPSAEARDHVTVHEPAGGPVRLRIRVRAEDPARGFLACEGRVTGLTLPRGPWVETETAVSLGDRVPTDDPVLLQFTVTGPDRTQAFRRAGRALAECSVEGVPTTLAWLRGLDWSGAQGPGSPVEPPAVPAAVQPLRRDGLGLPLRESLEVEVAGQRLELTFPAGLMEAVAEPDDA